MTANVHIQRLGLTDYKSVLEEQRAIQARLIKGEECNTIIICRHKTVITLGRRAKESNILVSQDVLKKNKIDVIKIERGGDITLHTPQQLMVYPLLNLDKIGHKNVHWYVDNIQKSVQDTLEELGMKSITFPDKPGVWISERKKISSLGIRISRWCTMHGFAINVLPSPEFNYIIPCGIKDIQMTSISEELKKEIPFDIIEELILKHFLHNMDLQAI